MTVCIAASCRYEDKPSLVLCCDERGNRGYYVSSDDSYKIRWVNEGLALMMAGGRTAADELFWSINEAVKTWGGSGTDELEIVRFKRDLEQSAHVRKRVLMDRYTRVNLGLNYEEFLTRGKGELSESIYIDTFAELRRINLGAELIVGTFGQDEPVIMRIAGDTTVYWDDHFSTVGTGGPIAEAFMVQRDYDDEMDISECLARVMEAKVAAEKNKDVGPTTVLEIMVLEENGPKRYSLSDRAFDAYESVTRRRVNRLPKVRFCGPLLESFDEQPGPTL